MSPAWQQLSFLYFELARAPGSEETRFSRFVKGFFSGGGCVVARYRLVRFSWLLLGRWAWLLNLLLLPVLMWCRALGGRHEFPPKAEIGRGLRLAHSCLPCVIHEQAVIGDFLTLTGSNVIGTRRRFQRGELLLGDHCLLGVGALVIGPLTVGDHVKIGAGALVVKSVPNGARVTSPGASARLPA